MARAATGRSVARIPEPEAARPRCGLLRGPCRPAACPRRPSPASRACPAIPPRGSAVACDRRPRSYRNQLLYLARGLPESLNFLFRDWGREIPQLAIRREIQVAGPNRVGEMAGDLDEVLGRFEDRAPAIDNPCDQPLVPVRAERLDVGLDQVNANRVDRQLQQLIDMPPSVAEVDVERQRRLQVTMQDLQRVRQRRPILARDARIAQPRILEVNE